MACDNRVIEYLNKLKELKSIKWHFMPENEEVLQLELPSTSIEYRRIEASFMRRYRITKIERIQNPFLIGRYNLKKEEYLTRMSSVNEYYLYHGTHLKNVNSICLNNFDWRKVVAHKFGHGVSFSPDPYYSHHYSKGAIKVMFIAKVLGGNFCQGYSDMLLPGDNFDISGNPKKVYVKYFDDEFFPAYLIYYY